MRWSQILTVGIQGIQCYPVTTLDLGHLFTCPYTIKFPSRLVSGTASGMASDCLCRGGHNQAKQIVYSNAHTPIPSNAHTLIPSNAHTPIPSNAHTLIPSNAHTLIPSNAHTLIPIMDVVN